MPEGDRVVTVRNICTWQRMTSSYDVRKEQELRIPLDFVVHAFIARRWERQVELCEFKVCLVYIGRSSPARV